MADFETTTDPNDCRVWGWSVSDIEDVENVTLGTDLDSFMEFITREPSHTYFHNLAFDASFIIDWLFRNEYTHVSKAPRHREFSTLISSSAQFYSVTIMAGNGVRVEFRDSLKKLPMGVSAVAKAFNLDESKLEIDYNAHRPIGHELTPEEREYMTNDVVIIARALSLQFKAGMKKLTVGADALNEYKTLTGKKSFERLFPILNDTMDAEIRKAYRGGFTYADPRFKGKLTRSGRVYDVNSLYPSVMYDRALPYDEPVFVDGKPQPTEDRPLFITSITFTAKLRPNHIPCIQVKASRFFIETEYQTNITEPVTMYCTNVDLDLWNEHYELEILSYNGSWMFHGGKGFFCDYIDKWMNVKANSNGGMRVIAKLQLNSLYGKFATNPDITPKIPILDPETDSVRLVLGEEDRRNPVYTPMGVFITSYARDVTIRAAQQHYDVFAYADTDSLHLMTTEDLDTLHVDDNALGAWKLEGEFDRALYIRAKQYMEHMVKTFKGGVATVVDHFDTHVAGLPRGIAQGLTFDDVLHGGTFGGKLVPRRVPGGVVLREVDFTLTVAPNSV